MEAVRFGEHAVANRPDGLVGLVGGGFAGAVVNEGIEFAHRQVVGARNHIVGQIRERAGETLAHFQNRLTGRRPRAEISDPAASDHQVGTRHARRRLNPPPASSGNNNMSYRRRIGRGYPRYVPRGNTQFHAMNCVEFKFLDTHASSDATAATTEIDVQLNVVPQGTTPSSRVGMKVFMSNVALNLLVDPDNTAASATKQTIYVRVMVIVDRQQNGEDWPTNDNIQATLLEAAGAPAVSSVLAYRELDETRRFWVLMDKILVFKSHPVMSAATTQITYFQPILCKFFHKFKKPLRTMYVTADLTGGPTFIQDNGLIFSIVNCEESTDDIDWSMTSRIRFTD